MPPRAIGFFAGLSYLRRGARFVYVEHRELARIWLVPVVLNTLLLAIGVYYALAQHRAVADWLWAVPSSDLGVSLHRVFEWLVALGLLMLSVVLVALVSNVVAAPANDLLSEAVERIAYGNQAREFSFTRAGREVVRAVGLELAKLALYLAVMAPLLVMNLVLPGVFAPVYALAGPCLTALFLAIDYMDWAASRRELRVKQRIAFALTNLRAALGFGLGIELLLFVPFLNLLFMPAAVAGATLLFVDLKAVSRRSS